MFIRTLKNKIYKYINSISKNVFIDKSDDIEQQNHRTIKMKPADVKSSKYIDHSKEINNKDPKLVIQLEYQKIKTVSQIGSVPNWSEEVFVIKKIKSTFSWTYVISYLKGKEIVGNFQKKELLQINQKEF